MEFDIKQLFVRWISDSHTYSWLLIKILHISAHLEPVGAC